MLPLPAEKLQNFFGVFLQFQIGVDISVHHDLPDELETKINESTVLYLADKQLQGTHAVTLEERFALSRKKCTSAQEREAHDRRYQQAKRVEAVIEKWVDSAGER